MPRVILRVIHPFHQDIFEGDELAGGKGQTGRRGDQLSEGIGLVDRHKPGAQGVVCRIERDCQVDRQGAAQPFQLGKQPRGGDGDPAVREVETGGIGQEAQCLQEIVVVGQGLSHAHEDKIDNRSGRKAFLSDVQHLVDNFGNRKIAQQSFHPRQAEGAAHGAAELG